jgi:hypothetical protein
MFTHTLARSTYTVEMLQVEQLNDRLGALDPTKGECLLITAEFLGLSGLPVHPRIVDDAVALIVHGERRRNAETTVLPGASLLRRMLTAGAPSFPYVYGVFGETLEGRRELPVLLHTDHLRTISGLLGLHRHHWGT